jgi:hypothetical protein
MYPHFALFQEFIYFKLKFPIYNYISEFVRHETLTITIYIVYGGINLNSNCLELDVSENGM